MRYWMVAMALALSAMPTFAQGAGSDFQDLAPAPVPAAERLRLSSVEAGPGEGVASAAERKPVDDRWFTLNKAHQYMGIGSLALVGAAVLVPPDEAEGGSGGEAEGGLHHNLAVAATVLGAGAVATGLMFHWNDLDFRHPLSDRDTLHALFGSLGELGFVLAVNAAPAGGHAATGMLGALSMALAIKLAW